MPHHQEVDSPAWLHPNDEQVSCDQGGTEILGDKREGEIDNIPFDESQHRVVKYHRVSTPDDHTSPSQVEEWVIVSVMRKHPATLADAAKVYDEATSSSVYFPIAENEWMAKELHMTKQGGELVIVSAQAELKKVILD